MHSELLLRPVGPRASTPRTGAPATWPSGSVCPSSPCRVSGVPSICSAGEGSGFRARAGESAARRPTTARTDALVGATAPPGNRETRLGPIMCRVVHVARVSCCTDFGKTPETVRKTRPRLLPVEIGRTAWRWTQAGANWSRCLPPSIYSINPSFGRAARFAGKVGRSGASAFWTRASNGSASSWRSASWREGAWKGPATRRSRNPRPPCPYSRENEPPKSPEAHACPGRVGMTQPEPGNCGSR